MADESWNTVTIEKSADVTIYCSATQTVKRTFTNKLHFNCLLFCTDIQDSSPCHILTQNPTNCRLNTAPGREMHLQILELHTCTSFYDMSQQVHGPFLQISKKYITIIETLTPWKQMISSQT